MSWYSLKELKEMSLEDFEILTKCYPLSFSFNLFVVCAMESSKDVFDFFKRKEDER